MREAGAPESVGNQALAAVSPRQMISLRLPTEVIARWKATGPGWQTRMAKRLEKMPLPRQNPK
ncbi:MAG: BrnA antitoxin family protein [bacterium]